MKMHRCLFLIRDVSLGQRLSSLRGLASATSNTDHLLQEKSVKIRTCKNVYSKMGDKKPFLFRKCPSSGIEMTVNYVDSLPSASYAAPTVLAVHGTPGSYNDYSPLLEMLISKGFRIISPNMPGLQFTDKTQTFRHTTEEKAEYLNDWLEEIGVSRIDVAMMHSSACYPTLELWQQKAGLIKSLVLLNPSGHRTIKAMKPVLYTSLAANINTHPIGKKLFMALGGLKPLRGVRNNRENAENAILALTTMHFAHVSRMLGYLQRIRESQTPSLYFFSERDKLVDTQIFHEMLDLLGGDMSLRNLLSKEGELLSEGTDHDWLRVMCVQEGGHYAFKSCPKILDREITRLLAQVYMTDVLRKVTAESDQDVWESETKTFVSRE